MLTSLTLTNYRGFSKLQIPKLARVNLIGGVNNAGKTAILEAIYMLLVRDHGRLESLPSLFRAAFRQDPEQYFWRWLSQNGNDKDVKIAANLDQQGSLAVIWSKNQPTLRPDLMPFGGPGGRYFAVTASKGGPTYPAPEVFSPGPTSPVEDAQIHIRAVRASPDAEERIERLLREIEPRLKRVRSFPDENTREPLIHVGLESGAALPATQFGQGFNRLLRIYSALLSAEATVFLIDEVETGLHHSVLPIVWKGLAAVARQENVQIFATTHSREAILAAHRVFSAEPEYDFAYHRLERDAQGEVQAVTYDQEALVGADEANFEVR